MPQATTASPPTLLDWNGVKVFASSAQAGTIFFVPAVPIPESDPKGRPAVSLVRSPMSKAMLQVGARFALTDSDLKSLQVWLLNRDNKTLPQLQPAPLAMTRAVLSLQASSGASQEIATSSTSLYPPYSAVFSATLSDLGGGLVAAALRSGQGGVLFVTYEFAAAGETVAVLGSGTLTRRADIASWFRDGSGAAHIQEIG
jgi:hypothetical protein